MGGRRVDRETFYGVNSALAVFRRGPGTPRWEAAAEYLVSHANADTQLLIDYVIERTRRDAGLAPRNFRARRGRRGWLVLALLGAAVLLVGLVGGFVYLFHNAGCI